MQHVWTEPAVLVELDDVKPYEHVSESLRVVVDVPSALTAAAPQDNTQPQAAGG